MDKRRHINIFEDMVLRASKEWQFPNLGLKSMDWFRRMVQETYSPKDVSRLFEDSKRLKEKPLIGKMYFFSYDPKHKKTLPYYDGFPFALPIDFTDDGFIGLNMHYLPYQHRAKLMDVLIRTVNDDSLSEKTKMRVSYQFLKSAAKYKLYKPTLKRYLTKHIKGRLVEVHAKEWPLALFLPVQDWRKSTQREVWRNSLKGI